MLRVRDIMTTDVLTLSPGTSLRDAAGADVGGVGGSFEAPTATAGDPLAAYTVDDVMTRSALALPPPTDVWAAVARMREADVHRLLVMEADTLLGVVTATDIARSVSERRRR